VHEDGVPEPEFGTAFTICLAASVINSVLGLILTFATLGSAELFYGLQAALLLIGFFVLATIARFQLPTTFGRASAVTGIFMLIGFAIVAVLVALAMLVLR